MSFNLNLTIGDEEKIDRIVTRYIEVTWRERQKPILPEHLKLSLTVLHLNNAPLHLDVLLEANAKIFIIAVEKMGLNLDRGTGKYVGGGRCPFTDPEPAVDYSEPICSVPGCCDPVSPGSKYCPDHRSLPPRFELKSRLKVATDSKPAPVCPRCKKEMRYQGREMRYERMGAVSGSIAWWCEKCGITTYTDIVQPVPEISKCMALGCNRSVVPGTYLCEKHLKAE